MLISTKGRYALRVMLDLAEHQSEEFISLKDIAQRQEISEKYLESIIRTLVKARVLESLREPFLLHDLPGREHMDDRIREHIRAYGIQPELLERRASQVSGGQIQRIVLARIMLLEPEFIVLDEPTSMLDVSVQAQIMELLHRIQIRTGVSYLLISHDLDLIQHSCHRMGVMRRGKLLEQGRAEAVFSAPSHPYTKELIQSFSYMRD